MSRPDIQFLVSHVSKFMHSPGSQHWKAVKWIFRYLSGTIHLGLFYPKGGSLPPDLHAFSDFDWAGCYDTRVSTSGFCFMLDSSWLSKKQPTVATSSCEAEYRAAFTATVECVWLRRLMADLSVGQDSATTIFTECWTGFCHHSLHWQSERIGSCEKPNFSCSHKAHWGALSLCQGETLSGRDQLGLCANTGQPRRSFHKGASSWEVWSFLQSFGLAPLCGLIYIGHGTSLYMSGSSRSRHPPKGDLLIYIGSDVCEHT